MALEFASVIEFGLNPTAALLTRGFSDYFVAIPFTAASLAATARADGVDLASSLVLVADGSPAGAALMARRGWTSRLAGMALVPEARRRGLGRALVKRLLADAAGRGDRAMELEVIEQNAPAVRLYEHCGFRRLRRLVGCSGAGLRPGGGLPALEEIDPREFGRLLCMHGRPDLPWQISGETLALLGPPCTAWRSEGAAALLSDTKAAAISIRGLLPGPGGADPAVALLQALMARFSARTWSAKAVFPEEYTGIFARAGLSPSPFTQWQMTVPLGRPGRPT